MSSQLLVNGRFHTQEPVLPSTTAGPAGKGRAGGTGAARVPGPGDGGPGPGASNPQPMSDRESRHR